MHLKRFGFHAILSATCEVAATKFASKKASIVARDRTVVRCLPRRQVEHDFVDIAPAPALRRIVALDDRMPGGVKMFGRMLVGRIVAAADMAAAAADPQVQPRAAALQAFLAAERARRDLADAGDVGAALCHLLLPLAHDDIRRTASLRGAKRRSNPVCSCGSGLLCFASLRSQ